jgi:bacterioferritin
MTDIEERSGENGAVVAALNQILELELAGVIRYVHYSFMIFGHSRIPIVGWLRAQADESLAHAILAGEHVTAVGGHPSLVIGELLDTRTQKVDEILNEALAHERLGLEAYVALLKLVAGKNIMLEEYARTQIAAEDQHQAEIRKMLRRG